MKAYIDHDHDPFNDSGLNKVEGMCDEIKKIWDYEERTSSCPIGINVQKDEKGHYLIFTDWSIDGCNGGVSHPYKFRYCPCCGEKIEFI